MQPKSFRQNLTSSATGRKSWSFRSRGRSWGIVTIPSEDIQTFQNIKELKERGFQLKAIKVLLPELKKRKADSSAEIIDLEQKLAEQEKEKAEPEGNITVFPLNPDLDRFQQFETIMTSLFRQTLKENNEELENRISDSVIHGMDVLMQLKEEKEEERFRRLDETIRLHQKNGTRGSGQSQAFSGCFAGKRNPQLT